MNWIQCLSNVIRYIEMHLTDDININEISSQSYTSSSHFQLIFHLVMGMTIGEYIRNRRLSLAAQDLLQPNSRIIDVAMRYQYDTQESFSKAFIRFHGVPPSKVQREKIKLFYPLTINVTIQGGFDMSRRFIDDILLVDWNEIDGQKKEKLTSVEVYNKLVDWACRARGQNPGVFDALAEWLLDDSEWIDEKLVENEQILIQGVFVRFKEQNAKLRAYLKELEPSGLVNMAIFKALDRFDDGLSGTLHDEPERLRETVGKAFSDFSNMRERGVREIITGYGMINMGYIEYLKNCDAGVQWVLFMPDSVKSGLESKKLNCEKFEYINLGKTRFIGIDAARTKKGSAELLADSEEFLSIMDSLTQEHSSVLNDNCFLIHHNGREWDKEGHYLTGRFFKADTSVPEGYDYFDIPTEKAAYAVYNSQNFNGDIFEPDDAYTFTRDQILGSGVPIPYPQKYWHAAVYTNGLPHQGNYRFGYLFSVEL